MSLVRALDEVLRGLTAGSGVVLIGYDQAATWTPGTLDMLLANGLLEPTSDAQSSECLGCEERCFRDVVVQRGKRGVTRAFIVCDVPGIQEVMGRVPVQLERLRQWRCTHELLARFICGLLGLGKPATATDDSARMHLGMLRTDRGRRWVSLQPQPLALEVNRQLLPLVELLLVEADEIVLDWPRIEHALSQRRDDTGKPYTPNTNRREARKQATQAMRQDWLDAYARLLKSNPSMSKKWYSQKIARMDVAQGKDSETIRKQLK